MRDEEKRVHASRERRATFVRVFATLLGLEVFKPHPRRDGPRVYAKMAGKPVSRRFLEFDMIEHGRKRCRS